MEIIIKIDENGKFSIDKSDGLPIFTAIGMMELAKSIMLKDNMEVGVPDEIEGQITLEEVME